jgi:alpha-L-rhamnosidase
MKTTFLKLAVIAIFLFLSNTGYTQSNDTNWLNKQWNASWITVSDINNTDYGVYLFRKNFELSAVPPTFPIYVSADNHYKLYVNEKLVSTGPARGDLLHWNFETVDLAPFLKQGKNSVAAKVWNEGELRGEANISLQTGFILQGGSDESQVLNSNTSWLSTPEKSYSPIPIILPEWYVTGPGEKLDMHQIIKGWQKNSFDDSAWKNAKIIGFGYPKNKIGFGGPNGWMLVPSTLPQMEMRELRIEQLRKSEGVSVPASFPKTKTAVTIPANTEATLLLDQSYLTNAYPTLVFSNGDKTSITISYAESLYTKGSHKGNRNEIEGKIVKGRKDIIISDGTNNQEFTTLYFRTYRYIELKIVTKESPLVLEDFYGTFTGYPFQMNAKLNTDHLEMQKMLEIGWRTARLCAVDTYMDCPYYEQLQYIGDTRIQCLVSLFNSGDDRLVKNAINLIDYSRQPEGVTLSRYPAHIPQYITPFSLLYISMLHDYMMYGNDSDFVKSKLLGTRQLLNYFSQFQQKDGSVKDLPWWNFTDWVDVKQWFFGVREAGKDGNSALIDMQLLIAYQEAATLEEKIGLKELATLYRENAEKLKNTIRIKYWDSSKNLFADRSEKDLFSQHTNSLAILSEVVSGNEARLIGQKMLSDVTLAPASIYFKFYLHQALTKAGLGNDYMNWLDKWRENMEMGLTTWAETSNLDTSRSDCHAWGASPNIEFFRILLGIDSEARGFSKVKIEPHLGTIKTIGGEIPHPNGKISVKYSQTNGRFNAEINLPKNTAGRFIWKGKSYKLQSGKNTLKI